MLTDEELVVASLQGDDAAFRAIVDRYQERLLRFLLARTASRADAEDAIQDTFISVYRYLASFDPRWRFSTWLFRIAIRNFARQKRLPAQFDETQLASKDDPLQDCIEQSERENIWAQARQLLSDEAYSALWLRYVEELSISEVSAVLERSQSWTKVTLMRGRRRLAASLDGDGFSLNTISGERYG